MEKIQRVPATHPGKKNPGSALLKMLNRGTVEVFNRKKKSHTP